MNLDTITCLKANGFSCEEIEARSGCSASEIRTVLQTPEGLRALGAAKADVRKAGRRPKNHHSKTIVPPALPVSVGDQPTVSSSRTSCKRKEFNEFLWDHTENPLQFDDHSLLTDNVCQDLLTIFSQDNLSSADRMGTVIGKTVGNDMSILHLLVQLAGITKNTLLQGIKAHAQVKNIKIRMSSLKAIFRTDHGRRILVKQLADDLIKVFAGKKGVSVNDIDLVYRSTRTQYNRQKMAKLSGHEPERMMACVLRDCGLPFAPEEKAENPMCGDSSVDGVSYDLVSPSETNALLRIASELHTANLGQYGVMKVPAVCKATKKLIGKLKNSGGITLLAFIDGVGMKSNQAILNGILSDASEFCQFRTIWKVPVIAAHKCGRRAVVALPKLQHARFTPFCERFAANLINRAVIDSIEGWVEAGDALVRIQRS